MCGVGLPARAPAGPRSLVGIEQGTPLAGCASLLQSTELDIHCHSRCMCCLPHSLRSKQAQTTAPSWCASHLGRPSELGWEACPEPSSRAASGHGFTSDRCFDADAEPLLRRNTSAGSKPILPSTAPSSCTTLKHPRFTHFMLIKGAPQCAHICGRPCSLLFPVWIDKCAKTVQLSVLPCHPAGEPTCHVSPSLSSCNFASSMHFPHSCEIIVRRTCRKRAMLSRMPVGPPGGRGALPWTSP